MAWALDGRPELLDAGRRRPTGGRVGLPRAAGALRPSIASRRHHRGFPGTGPAEYPPGGQRRVDFVAAQGTEAGGHTGRVGTLPLLRVLLESLDLPVLAAGGIAIACGLAGVLAAGAAGDWVVTCLLASPETVATPRSRILVARKTDTVLARVFDIAQGIGWPEGFAGRALAQPLHRTLA